MNKNKQRSETALPGMPSILDRELRERDGDAFGHQSYADALRDLIESPQNTPPFSIGLLGPWGTGKSTIKEFYRRGLESDKTGKVGNRRSDRVHAITFNAWRFGGEQDLKRALLRDAFRQLGGDESALRSELFEQVNTITHHKRSFREWAGEAFGQLIGTVGVFAVLLGLILLGIFVFVRLIGLDDATSLAGVTVAALLATGWIGKHIVDLRVRTPAMFLPQTSVSFPSTSAEEYERLLIEQIDRFRAGPGNHCQRLVIFVDDLDRLSAPEMVNGLDAIRTFLELPFNTTKNGFGVVFVISCDEDKIAEALHRGRGRLGAAEMPGSVFSRADARRYLDRLFQFRLEIPLFPKQDMRQFAMNKLAEAKEVIADLESKNIAAANVIDRLIHVDVQSPRNAIQLLNAFIQSWWIAKQREKDGIGTSSPGALHAGAVTNHPLSLAALCVLRVDFPDFYDCVQARPDFIHEFRRVLFGTEKASDQAVVVQDMLSKFISKDADGKFGSDVVSEYRKLRQYLSSIQDLRWPKRLQPLLRLSEDPITRQYGDRAAAIHDALVSGDIRGVLEGFGRELDNNALSQEDITLLEGLTDTLSQETEARRINASRVLASLVERIPADRSRGLLTPLVRQMVNLRPVRINVGPKAAHAILQHATKDDRREVAERFIEDLLHGDALDWQNAGGGTINLQEGIQLVHEALELALDVRGISGLPTSADEKLLDWLLSRTIQVGDKSHTLPFVKLESLVDQHSAHLLMDLDSDYSDQAIAAFQTEPATLTVQEETLHRVTSIFDQLAENGQEDRQVMWDQLTRLISVQPGDAVEQAWKAAEKHSGLANGNQACAFLIAFAGRLKKEMDDAENWSLDWSTGARLFNDFLTQWQTDIDADTGAAIEPLISAWALTQDCDEHAIRALNLLQENIKPAWDAAVASIIQSELEETPVKICSYMGHQAASFTDSHATNLVAQMDAFIDQAQPDEAAAERYREFLYVIPQETWAMAPWASHLERLFARLAAMHADAAFLTRVYSSAIALFRASPKGRTAKLLTPLFQNAAGVPEAYVTLHRLMLGNWPPADEHYGNYNPNNIVERACQFIEANPTHSGIGDILRSLIYLHERNIASSDVGKQIASAMPHVWRASPGSLLKHSEYVGNALEEPHIVAILTGDQNSKLEIDQLQTLLSSVADAQPSEASYEVLKGVLASQPNPLFDVPDGVVKFWLDALRDKAFAISEQAMSDDVLNDAQKRRVASKLDDSFWTDGDMNAVQSILTSSTASETRALVIDRVKVIAEQSLSPDLKTGLSSRLIASLSSLAGDQLDTVSRAILKLGGKGALENSVTILDAFDTDQIEILRKVFPDSRSLAKLKAG